ncbi:MAG: hypothetical protein HZA35_02855 [Parcubacteria group bacterium]|nr:hypothetical protein [Parcubacteria group bacterium]
MKETPSQEKPINVVIDKNGNAVGTTEDLKRYTEQRRREQEASGFAAPENSREDRLKEKEIAFGAGAEKFKQSASALWRRLKGGVKSTFDMIKKVPGKIYAHVAVGAEDIGTRWKEEMKTTQDAWKQDKENLGKGRRQIGSFIKKDWEHTKGDWENVKTGVVERANDAGRFMVEIKDGFVDGYKNVRDGAIKGCGRILEGIRSMVSSKALEGLSATIDFLNTKRQAIENAQGILKTQAEKQDLPGNFEKIVAMQTVGAVYDPKQEAFLEALAGGDKKTWEDFRNNKASQSAKDRGDDNDGLFLGWEQKDFQELLRRKMRHIIDSQRK